ncbi:veficolin-1-like [Stylophora pistillata]|uniref:veficolin-1-like n=1 Tax=Stylophora pistillata TaxID=50429 RepID=UPI000C03C305|nr:veficolin-1-like [Stylophora pistillata]
MFRLFFVLALAFLLSSFVKSQNKSANQSHGTAKKSNCCASRAGYCKDGKDGKDGQNGKDGRDGVNGRDGRDGPVGPKGEKGESGVCSVKEKAGVQGEKGSAGQKGSKGEKGQKGMLGTCDHQSSSSSSTKRECCKVECSTGFHFFEKVQDLPTRGAAAVQHFTINGSLFLAFGNYYGDIHYYKTSSMIYKMDETTGKFTFYQTLQTRGALGVEYFSIADKRFLAVANNHDGTYQLDSVIFQ